MQVSSVRVVAECDSQSAIRSRAKTDAPLSPGVCLAIWAAMSGLGWGLVGVLAALVG